MKSKMYQKISTLTVIATLLILVNQYLLITIHANTMPGNVSMTGDITGDAISIAIPQGVPEIYGVEMGITYDEVQSAINAMKVYDPEYGSNRITHTGEKLQRYIDITTKISCEYCCGVNAITRSDGSAACGCAHSQAMRGLTAYLLEYHPEEFTNDEILRELARWKGRYFPKQMIDKIITQIQSGDFTHDVASLLMGIDISQYAGTSSPLPSDLESLPEMVGGC